MKNNKNKYETMKIYIKTIKSDIVAISSYIIDENPIKKVVLWPFLAKNVQNCTFQIIL